MCFEDIKNDIIEKDLNFSNSTIDQVFFNQKNDFYKKLQNSTIAVDQKTIDLDKYDYVITYGWAKYYGMTYKNSQVVDIYNYIKQNNKKVLIVAVNIDSMDFWNDSTSR